MKLKGAVLNRKKFPWGEAIIAKLDSEEFHLAYIQGVVIGCLMVPREVVERSPAGYYTQHCDEGWGGFCDALAIEVRLTGVSKNDDRAPNNFVRALEVLVGLYRTLYRTTVASVTPIGKRTHVFITIMTDKSVEFADGTTKVFFEFEFWVDGTVPAT